MALLHPWCCEGYRALLLPFHASLPPPTDWMHVLQSNRLEVFSIFRNTSNENLFRNWIQMLDCSCKLHDQDWLLTFSIQNLIMKVQLNQPCPWQMTVQFGRTTKTVLFKSVTIIVTGLLIVVSLTRKRKVLFILIMLMCFTDQLLRTTVVCWIQVSLCQEGQWKISKCASTKEITNFISHITTPVSH